jgi:hypothetical protein
LLNDGYSRQAWKSLGFANWTECLKGLADEFGFSERRLWQLHSANQIETDLLNQGSVGSLSERQARELAKIKDPETRADKLRQATTRRRHVRTVQRVRNCAQRESLKLSLSHFFSVELVETYPAAMIPLARKTAAIP